MTDDNLDRIVDRIVDLETRMMRNSDELAEAFGMNNARTIWGRAILTFADLARLSGVDDAERTAISISAARILLDIERKTQ